jgi:cell division protease FtsH
MAIIARGTPGFSGADLENLINEAALMAAREDATKITKDMLDRAKDKILMGAERRSMVITDKEKEVTAYHEAGHALIARLLPDTDPIHKVTIIPRGRALGLTMQLPTEERYTHSRTFLEHTLCILFGGRIAEKIIFNEITTGAGNDLQRATDMARRMVCEWGMSEELGPLTYGKKEEQIFLGREIAQHRDFSEDTARKIDGAVKHIITEATVQTTNLLTEHTDVLTRMAAELLEKETIVLEDIERILAELRPGQYDPVVVQGTKVIRMTKQEIKPQGVDTPVSQATEDTPELEQSTASEQSTAASPETTAGKEAAARETTPSMESPGVVPGKE